MSSAHTTRTRRSTDPAEVGAAIDQVRDAQRRFQRVLANWASDMLQLQALAWRHPKWTPLAGTAPDGEPRQEAA